MEGCFELIGYPEWWTPRTPITKTSAGKTKVQPQVHPRATTTTTEDPQIQGLGLTKGEYEKLIKMIRETKTTPTVNMTGKTKTHDEWIIDSGASEHVTHNKALFKTMKENLNSTSVTIPNGDTINIEGVGNIHIPNGFGLKSVLNVSGFKCNLLFVSKLANDLQCSLTFLPKTCFI